MNSRYEGLLRKIYSEKWAVVCLSLFSHLAVILTVFAFCFVSYRHFTASVFRGAAFLVTEAVPFLIVTLLRRWLNWPRPYELCEVFEASPKKTEGKSFPSRHAYSAFAVAVPFCFLNLGLGLSLSFVAFLMCLVRVLLGYHFVKDVTAGAVMGVIAGFGTAFAVLQF